MYVCILLNTYTYKQYEHEMSSHMFSRYSYNHIEFITDHHYAESQSKVFLIDIINFNTLTINSVAKNFQLLILTK